MILNLVYVAQKLSVFKPNIELFTSVLIVAIVTLLIETCYYTCPKQIIVCIELLIYGEIFFFNISLQYFSNKNVMLNFE